MKQISIELGGENRVIDVGKFWFTKFYGEATGSDPINSTDIIINPEKQFDFVVNMVYAGLKADCTVHKREINFTKEDVQYWVGCLEDDRVSELINEYVRITSKPEKKGEAETQAAQG
jgi:hypothetical protein